jgi:hypothetical protein
MSAIAPQLNFRVTEAFSDPSGGSFYAAARRIAECLLLTVVRALEVAVAYASAVSAEAALADGRCPPRTAPMANKHAPTNMRIRYS